MNSQVFIPASAYLAGQFNLCYRDGQEISVQASGICCHTQPSLQSQEHVIVTQPAAQLKLSTLSVMEAIDKQEP